MYVAVHISQISLSIIRLGEYKNYDKKDRMAERSEAPDAVQSEESGASSRYGGGSEFGGSVIGVIKAFFFFF